MKNLSIKAILLIAIIFSITKGRSIIQSKQYSYNILHFTNMAKEHYWSVFGQVSINNFSKERI